MLRRGQTLVPCMFCMNQGINVYPFGILNVGGILHTKNIDYPRPPKRTLFSAGMRGGYLQRYVSTKFLGVLLSVGPPLWLGLQEG